MKTMADVRELLEIILDEAELWGASHEFDAARGSLIRALMAQFDCTEPMKLSSVPSHVAINKECCDILDILKEMTTL